MICEGDDPHPATILRLVHVASISFNRRFEHLDYTSSEKSPFRSANINIAGWSWPGYRQSFEQSLLLQKAARRKRLTLERAARRFQGPGSE